MKRILTVLLLSALFLIQGYHAMASGAYYSHNSGNGNDIMLLIYFFIGILVVSGLINLLAIIFALRPGRSDPASFFIYIGIICNLFIGIGLLLLMPGGRKGAGGGPYQIMIILGAFSLDAFYFYRLKEKNREPKQ